MKKLLTIALLLVSLTSGAQITMTLTPGGDGGVFLINDGTITPGSTLYIDSIYGSTYKYIFLSKLVGTKENPIRIRNRGYVHMRGGIDLSDSRYVIIEGNGANNVDTAQGIWIEGRFLEPSTVSDQVCESEFETPGVGGSRITYANCGLTGIKIHGFSKNVSVTKVRVSKAKYGMQIKVDEECDTLLRYPYWYTDSVEVSYSRFDSTESQGIYAFTTLPDNDTTRGRVINCSGVNVYANPPRGGNLHVHHNTFFKNGRSSIQASCAPVGMTHIHHNTIKYSGTQTDLAQPANIFTGGYTRAVIEYNNCSNALAYGIQVFGTNTRLNNNNIDSAGYTRHMLAGDTFYRYNPGAAVQVRASKKLHPVSRPEIQDSIQVEIFNNTITNSRNWDIGLIGRSVIGLYSTPGSEGVWSYFNKHFGNTYNGAPLEADSCLDYGAELHIVNQAVTPGPLVDAGWDYFIDSAAHRQSGGAKDPDGTIVSYSWSQVSGPTGPVIETPTAPQTTFSSLKNGTYVFRLTATDNSGNSKYDDARIVVYGLGGDPGTPWEPIIRNYWKRRNGGPIKFKQ